MSSFANAPLRLLAAVTFVASGAPPSTAMDASCNGLQHTQLMNEIAHASVSSEERQQYEARASEFATEMTGLLHEATPFEQEINTARYQQAEGLFKAASREAQVAAVEFVKSKDPQLFARGVATGADNEAILRLNWATYSKFAEDPEARKSLQSRLFRDSVYVDNLAEDLKIQGKAHELEGRLWAFRTSVPVAAAQRELVQRQLSDRYVRLAEGDRDKQEALHRAASDMPILRTLFAASGLAERIASGSDDFKSMQAMSFLSQGVMDDRVTAEALGAFGQVTASIAKTNFRAELDYVHATFNYTPSHGPLRREVMLNPASALAKATAPTLAKAMQDFHKGKVASDRLVKAMPPLPDIDSPAEAPAQTAQFVREASEILRDVAKEVKVTFEFD